MDKLPIGSNDVPTKSIICLTGKLDGKKCKPLLYLQEPKESVKCFMKNLNEIPLLLVRLVV